MATKFFRRQENAAALGDDMSATMFTDKTFNTR